MGYLTEHAKDEFKYAGWTNNNGVFNDEMQEMICKDVLHLLNILENQEHSGGSIGYALNLFQRLAKQKCISPLNSLEDNPEEWLEVDEGVYQNKRSGHVFYDEKRGYYDISARVKWEWSDEENSIPYKLYFTDGSCFKKVEMPYSPPNAPEEIFVPNAEFPTEVLK